MRSSFLLGSVGSCAYNFRFFRLVASCNVFVHVDIIITLTTQYSVGFIECTSLFVSLPLLMILLSHLMITSSRHLPYLLTYYPYPCPSSSSHFIVFQFSSSPPSSAFFAYITPHRLFPVHVQTRPHIITLVVVFPSCTVRVVALASIEKSMVHDQKYGFVV